MSVPVLSLQMTVVLPRVSAAGSRRTIAWRSAMRLTPIARVIVTAAGSPSGIAPTASATAAVSMSAARSPRASPRAKVNAASAMIATVSAALNAVSLRVSGVAMSVASSTRRWMRPRAVSAPVATAIPSARPARTSVPAKARFARSASPVSGSSVSVCLSTGTDSPVSIDSSTRSPATRTSRMSAGTRSPASRWIRSPGTTSCESTTRRRPSRTITARVRASDISARSDPSARDSCTNPIVALTTTTPAITDASTVSPIAAVTAAAAIRT